MRDPFWWIAGGGLLMSTIALVGGLTLVLPEHTLRRIVLPLVALSAGSLLGGAFFHMIPASVDELGNDLALYVWVVAGFSAFFVLEQFLHWHHCHRPTSEHRQPLGILILIADGLHNFMGGLAVGGAFLVDLRVGITTWIAAAAHEIPQELGDFGVLVHGGWPPARALLYNLLSALTFLVGGLTAWLLSQTFEVGFLVPLAAGNFLYIAAADLIPEIRRHPRWQTNLIHLVSFALGLGLLLAIRLAFEGH